MAATAQVLPKNDPVRILALGDSYTIGEGVDESQRWPVQLVNALMLQGYTCHQPEIVAVTGWRTDDLRRGLEQRKLPKAYNLVSLLIGVNNQYQGKDLNEYGKEFEELLRTAIEYAGRRKGNVFVLSIPDYGFTPFGREKQQEISRQIDAFNEVNESIAGKLGVNYVNITDISRQGLSRPQLVADDGLHPSAEMYALWVERILHQLF